MLRISALEDIQERAYERRMRVQTALKSGARYGEIAQRLGVSTTMVWHINGQGLDLRPPNIEPRSTSQLIDDYYFQGSGRKKYRFSDPKRVAKAMILTLEVFMRPKC